MAAYDVNFNLIAFGKAASLEEIKINRRVSFSLAGKEKIVSVMRESDKNGQPVFRFLIMDTEHLPTDI
jgi:hypothetical protein